MQQIGFTMKNSEIFRMTAILYAGIAVMTLISITSAQTLIDYFLPMPIVKPLRQDKWGCALTGKRDICNGLEDTTNRSYSYWDGPIIKGPDGKYHMLASRWNQSGGHWAWLSSVGVHAVSESVMGPYVDKGLTWPTNQAGKGHNLTILQLKEGTYASLVSDTRPGDFFTAPSLDGPWTFAGSIRIEANGFTKPSHLANLSMIIRPDDGRYMIVDRGGQIMISSGGLTGPYLIQGRSVYTTVNLPNLEDPVLWYSGGYYHIVVNSWSEKKAFHLRSKNGISNWTNEGLAFDPRSNFLRYTDGTVNKWTKIERPGVYLENGHITHWTFSVIDSEKEQDLGNDDHNSKVIIVPFDGVAFDGANVPENRDTIYNGNFNLRTAGWTLNVWAGSATGEVINGEYATEISSLGSQNYDIQLVQAGLILRQGLHYQVSFDAYASSNRPLEVNVEMANSPWTSYLQEVQTFNLTTTKTPYSFTFKMEEPTDSNGRLGFNFGASTNTVLLDNIVLKQVEPTVSIPVLSNNRKKKFNLKYEQSVLKVEFNASPSANPILTVYNLKGSELFSTRIINDQVFTTTLPDLPNGVYTVCLKSRGATIYKDKFLKQD